jgi:oligosaccharide repeat unit polymerase
MLLISILILALLVALNYRLGGRAPFYPPVVFSLVWMFVLLLIWLVGDFFYPISPVTILIFVGGALVFSVGSAIALLFPNSKPPRPITKWSNRFISLLVLVVVCGTPLALRWLVQQINQHPSSNFFVSASLTMLDESVEATLGYELFGNFVVFCNAVALMAFLHQENHKRRWLIAFVLTLGLDVSIAARSAFIPLFFSLFFLDWLKHRRLRWKLLVASGLVLVVLAGAIAVYLGKVGASQTASVSDNALPVFQGLLVYAVGAAVTFDAVVRDPAIPHHAGQIYSPFVRILNRLGAQIEVDEAGPGYTEVGPHHISTNVYTIYYSYMDLGYPGMMAIMAFLGFAIAMCYRSALAGNRISSILYGGFFSSLVLSPFAELFFSNVYSLAKVFLLLWCVYSLPEAWSSSRRFLRRSVDRDLAAAESESV